jgi:transposase-like protein
MELARRSEKRGEFSPGFEREFVGKIVLMDKAVGELAEKLGIPPEVMHKWSLMVERAEMTLVPASRIIELERDIEDLKHQIDHQATTIEILEKHRRL